ncbi:MAG: DUF1761 domain-containing protein [Saprospiraceae bacterium]
MQPHFNVVSYLIAALVPMVMGFLYFHPSLFGNTWMKANGFDKESMGKPQLSSILLGLGASLLLAFFLWGWTTGAGGVDAFQVADAKDGHSHITFGHGVFHGLALSILVLLPIFTIVKAFERRSWSWALVNVGYWAVNLMLMCGILSAWR